uniref:Vacuolar protein 8 n=1 Tax=Manihot esculenta TaxID=3983 RepID=A0A2C9WAH6_MANES
MAATGFGNYRNGTQSSRTSLGSSNKVDKPLSVNSNPKNPSLKSKSLNSSGLRKSAPGSLGASTGAAKDDAGVPGRVRVAVRLRPRNAEEMVADADFADCVELQPELKRLKLRKNNWDSDTYEFDEVLTEFASQKRVYEVVAKPVVESVLGGYNGTVMAYGQTGTGKTYTLGRLGEEDTAARGIMVRAMEDIFAGVSQGTDSVSVSYLQLYMETIQDLFDPTNDNISIVEDPKTGDVSLPGASLVDIRDQQSFVELLRLGEAHRFAANTKLNTESSRSHAILMAVMKSEYFIIVTLLARTSLVITIGPSPRHRGETASTIMFGQRAMKVENMLKLKEEFDYKSLARRLDIQLDKVIAEHERQQKSFEKEIERITREAQNQISEVERKYADALEKERVKYHEECMESIKKLEEKWMKNQQKHAIDGNKVGLKGDGSDVTSKGEVAAVKEVAELKKLLQKEALLMKAAQEEVDNLKSQLAQSKKLEATANSEILKLRKMLEDEACQKQKLEGEIAMLQSRLLQISFDTDETRKRLDKGGSEKILSGLDSQMSQLRQPQLNAAGNGEKASIAKLFEQVGLHKILSLLEAEDADVRIHAVKVVANLAAEETNQEKIVEAGGLTSLLTLLKSSGDETIHRVAAGAIANLAMNEKNQELIMAQGGIRFLSMTAANAEDPQTLRMVAGAIANLCGNDKLQTKLRGEGGIKALLGMVKSRHPDVLAQVARGIANFAKCESRASTQGSKNGRSLLIEDGALPWIVQNANNETSQIRRHIELALCHLAQHELNARDMISGGALWELVRISRDCSREDIRTLANRTLASSSIFQAELRRLRIEH